MNTTSEKNEPFITWPITPEKMIDMPLRIS